MDYAIDAWDPQYGAAMAPTLDESTGSVDRDVEVAEADWAPIPSSGPPAGDVLFVDGVRRVDARVWSIGADQTEPALAVSVAAGAVRCNGRAEVVDTRVRRLLVGRAGLEPIVGQGLTWQPLAAAVDDDASMIGVVQREMGRLEAKVAADLPPAELTVLDGPLSGHEHRRDVVGYVKSHRVSYLRGPEFEAVVRALAPGERTPLFVVEALRTRYSWYLRLPGGSGHPWSGVVRLELPNTLEREAAVAVADLVGATLPRFASPPHWDARAPVNLLPIAGLEDTLHHLLGNRHFLHRRLLAATA